MPRVLLWYTFSLTLRSIVIAAVAGTLTCRMRDVTLRHAIWTVVLAAILLMPLGDAILPATSALVPLRPIVLSPEMLSTFAPSTASPVPAAASSIPAVSPTPARDWWALAAFLTLATTLGLLLRLVLAYRQVGWMKRQSRPVSVSLIEASVLWTGNAERYAEALLYFAAAAKNGHRLIGEVAMARHKIGSRIERVLAVRRPGCGVLSQTQCAVLLVVAMPVLYASAALGSSESKTAAVPPAEVIRVVVPVPEPAPVSASVLPAAAAHLQIAPPTPPAVALAPPQPGTPSPLPQIDSPRTGIFRYFQNWAGAPPQPANTFGFALTDVQARTVSFADNKGGTFSYGCADCSFVVWESGVAEATTNPGPGIAFKLSADGSSLTATCRSVECSVSRIRRAANDLSYSGPVIKNKTFFFALWDQQTNGAGPVVRQDGAVVVPAEAISVFSNSATVTLALAATPPPNPNTSLSNPGVRCFITRADGTVEFTPDCPGVTVSEVFYFSVLK